MNQRNCLSLLSLIAISVCGCSNTPEGPPTVDAKGIVTLDGTPVEGATVVFVAADGSSNSASGMCAKDGSFSLDSFNYKPGTVPGTYNAIVTKNEEVTTSEGELEGEEAEHAAESGSQQLGVKNVLPSKYQQPSNSFQFIVPEGGVTDLKVELTSN